MAVIYVAEQGATLRRVSQRLVVVKGGVVLEERPAFSLERILLFGNVQVTTQTLALLLEQGAEISYFSLGGRLRGSLTAPKARNVLLRLAQFDAWRDPQRRLELAGSFVIGKIRNQRSVLQRYQRNRNLDFAAAILSLGDLAEGAAAATDHSELMGLEGLAGRSYFQAWRGVFSRELGFGARQRRPPPDPVNALLSLGYALLGAELGSLLEGLAFDPCLGYLHGIRYGRLSLGLDLLEEFRSPIVDVFIGELVNKGILQAADFQTEGGACRLTTLSLKRFFHLYEERLRGNGANSNWREIIRLQAQKLREAVLEGGEYEPHAIR